MVSRFGPPARDIGSGNSIEQWDIAGGVLTYHPAGPSFEGADGRHIRLMRTTNLAGEVLFGTYEMLTLPDPSNHGTRYWIGNVDLSGDHFAYRDSGQNFGHRAEQQDNFFIKHPDGKVRVEYGDGIVAATRLEDLKDGSVVARITFEASGGGPSRTYSIVACPSAMILEFSSNDALTFVLYKHWKNYWR